MHRNNLVQAQRFKHVKQGTSITLLCLLAMFAVPGGTFADLAIVDNGQPRAAIVIAEDPPRLVKLAAEELRTYIKKITGAELPIGTAPDPTLPVTIYVGRSAFTDKQGITDEGLRHGAYRMVSGPDWLILLGRDRDFQPREPWSRTRDDYPETQAAWEKLYGGPCAHPLNWYGGTTTSLNRDTGIWRQDEGGSLQAVYALLRDLGVRWYWPGETGEVVPHKESIALPEIDRAAHPDFAIRNHMWYNRFHLAPADNILWWLRLGLNDGYTLLGASMPAHGMRLIHGNKSMRENHPEYFALYRGKRDTEYRGTGHACFSSPGLFDETVKYLRAVFDHFDEPAMDLWPQDGYHHCGCALCAGKSPSDLVWGFVDRVARELYKTHPDRLITCGAYTPYIRSPDSIDEFSPNVAVGIANRGRPYLDAPARWRSYWDLVMGWQAKLAPSRLVRYENNRQLTALIIHPRSYARDLRALKGVSLGDTGEVMRGTPSSDCWPNQWPNPAVNHLNIYVQSRLLWDAELDLDELLQEYYTLFYGPAAGVMREALEYAEQNYDRSPRQGRAGLGLAGRVAFIERLHAARALTGDDVYGRRIQTFIDELRPLDELRAELQAQQEAGNPRDQAPVAVAQRLDAGAEPQTYTFRPKVAWRHRESALPVATTFSVAWTDDALVFDIRCREPDMANLEIGANVWEGDSVLIFLETPRHSHYMIQVAPDGRVFDADRNAAGRLLPQWSSQAEVETERDEDFWRVRARIPLAVIGDDEEFGDPLHSVVAPRPGAGEWFFNIGRTRLRDGRRMQGEHGYAPFAFSPTDEPMHLVEVFHPRHFARLKFSMPDAGLERQ